MWIHVPSIPFPSVPGTEELSLDSEQLSQLESSVMWKSNFQQQKSWQNVWKKRLSMRRLSGLLLKPSTLNRGVEKWICSLEGSLASPSASPGRSLEKMIQETSGPTQPDLLGGLGFQSSFLKMCQESSDTTTKPYDPNYERWVTQLRKDYSQRQKQAHLTSVSESLSWPTPNTMDILPPRSDESNKERFTTGQRSGRSTPDNLREFVQPEMHPKNWPTVTATERSGINPNTGHGEGLSKTAKNWNKEIGKWPTPNVSDNNDPNLKDNHDLEKGYLRGVVTTWPTPMQRDYKGFDGAGKKNALKPRELYLSTLQDQETEKHGQDSLQDSQNLNQPFAKKGICSPKCRRLNPNFAEHLMGLPAGWTSVSEPLEMGLYRLWQDALSENLREN